MAFFKISINLRIKWFRSISIEKQNKIDVILEFCFQIEIQL